MRDYGLHTIPSTSTLPATGVAGQLVSYMGEPWYWNSVQNMWMPMGDWIDITLGSTITNSTTSMATTFTFNAVAGAVYDIEWKLIWQVTSTGTLSTTVLKTGLLFPSGATAGVMAETSAVKAGATAPTFNQLGTSGTTQSGPTATANTPALQIGRGLIVMSTTAGAVSLQHAPSTANMLMLMAGSTFRYKRVW